MGSPFPEKIEQPFEPENEDEQWINIVPEAAESEIHDPNISKHKHDAGTD